MDKLTPEERADWDDFVDRARKDAATKIAESAFVMSLVPDREKVDIKFAVELGLAIMADKPIIAVVMPGVQVSSRLRMVADEVVELEADLDTQAGRDELQDCFQRVLKRLQDEEPPE